MIEWRPITERTSWLKWRQEALLRFEAKAIPEPMSGCWLWTGAMVPDGYGSTHWPFDGRTTLKAHRAAWIFYRGDLADDQQVLHRCDTRACVNPDHLFLGDNVTNVADRVAKNRSAHIRGVHQGRAKLTERDALQILADPRPHWKIAADYGISEGPVSQIKAGKLWTHVTGGRTDIRGALRGERVGNSKLTAEEVRQIRADVRSHSVIASDFHVSRSHVGDIKRRKRWSHVD